MGRKKNRADQIEVLREGMDKVRRRWAEQKRAAESILARPDTNNGIFVHKGKPEIVTDAERIRGNRWLQEAMTSLEALKASFHTPPEKRFEGVDSRPQLTEMELSVHTEIGLMVSKTMLDKMLAEVARLESEGEQEHPGMYWAFMAGVCLALSGAQIESFHLYKRHNSSSIGSRRGGGQNRKRPEVMANEREAYLEMAKDLRKRNHIRSASSILEEVGKEYEVTRRTVRNHLTDEDIESLKPTE